MDEFVRPASADDTDDLSRLEAEHREALSSVARGGLQWLRDHPALGPSGWHARLDDTASNVFVAGVDGVVLGFASLQMGGGSGSVAVVDQIFVTAGAREIGLGDALVASLLEGARQRGADDIEATALPGDRDTKNLFERSGLVARLIVVSRSLRT